MTSSRITGGSGIRARRIALAALAALAAVVGVVALSGFHTQLREIDPTGPDAASEVFHRRDRRHPHVPPHRPASGSHADLEYGTREDGALLTLDICMPPPGAAARPAVVSIHGGSWARGDKANADWRNVCLWLASEGFVAASVNYRLVPDVRFPAALDDVALAVEWLRAPEQVEQFGIDPARIGAFGGSAGGNLAGEPQADVAPVRRSPCRRVPSCPPWMETTAGRAAAPGGGMQMSRVSKRAVLTVCFPQVGMCLEAGRWGVNVRMPTVSAVETSLAASRTRRIDLAQLRTGEREREPAPTTAASAASAARAIGKVARMPEPPGLGRCHTRAPRSGVQGVLTRWRPTAKSWRSRTVGGAPTYCPNCGYAAVAVPRVEGLAGRWRAPVSTGPSRRSRAAASARCDRQEARDAEPAVARESTNMR